MGFGDGAKELTAKIFEFHADLIAQREQFAHLRQDTEKVLTDLKHIVEKTDDRVRSLESDRDSLLNKIEALESRLSMLSEKALHVAITDAAKDAARDAMAGGQSIDIPQSRKSKKLDGQ